MKNLVRLLLCLSLAGFTIARATTPGSALFATARTMQKKPSGQKADAETLLHDAKKAEAAMVKVARTDKGLDPKEPKDESFDMSESEEDEVAGEEDTDEEVASDDDDSIEDVSDDEGEDMSDDDGGDNDGGDDGADDGGD